MDIMTVTAHYDILNTITYLSLKSQTDFIYILDKHSFIYTKKAKEYHNVIMLS